MGKRDATHELQPRIRQVHFYLEYLSQKWTKIDSDARDKITLEVRAAIARHAYYHKRVEFFEGINRQSIVGLIQATVMRQKYFEMKTHYLEGELLIEERERFVIYDGKSQEYMEDQKVEEQAAAVEREHALEEDQYAVSLHEARIEEIYSQDKSCCVLECEEWYKKAAQAAKMYRAQVQAHGDLEDKYAEHQAEMDEGAHKRVYMMLKEQYDHLGKTELYPFEEGRAPNDAALTLVAPALRALPPDMDSVVMMKRYINKGRVPPRKDLSEGFDLSEQQAAESTAGTEEQASADEQQAVVAADNGEAIQTSVELELSMDPSQLSPEEQVKFLNELASMMGVDASTLSIHSLKK